MLSGTSLRFSETSQNEDSADEDSPHVQVPAQYQLAWRVGLLPVPEMRLSGVQRQVMEPVFWSAIKDCPECGQPLDLDFESEVAYCPSCGYSHGGANFWAEPNP